MELIRSKKLAKNKFFEPYGGALRRPETYERKSDKLLIESLRDDNAFIKQRLLDLESRLEPSREKKIVKKFYDSYYDNSASTAPITVSRRGSNSRIQSTKPENYGVLNYRNSTNRRYSTTPVANQLTNRCFTASQALYPTKRKLNRKPTQPLSTAGTTITGNTRSKVRTPTRSQSRSRPTTPTTALSQSRPTTPTTPSKSRPVTPVYSRAAARDNPYDAATDYYYGPSFRQERPNIGRNLRPIPTRCLYVPKSDNFVYPPHRYGQPAHDFTRRVIKTPRPFNSFAGEPHASANASMANFADDEYYYYYFDEAGGRITPSGYETNMGLYYGDQDDMFGGQSISRSSSRSSRRGGDEDNEDRISNAGDNEQRPSSARSQKSARSESHNSIKQEENNDNNRPVSRSSSRQSVKDNNDDQEEQRPVSRNSNYKENSNEEKIRVKSAVESLTRSADPRFRQSRPKSSDTKQQEKSGSLAKKDLKQEAAAAAANASRKGSAISRSKSLNEIEQERQKYVRWLYSSSWRIHGELMAQVEPNGPDMTVPIDSTSTLFYKTKGKRPETFIFDPNWI